MGPTGDTPRDRDRASTTDWTIRSFTSPGTTRERTAAGPGARLPTEAEWEYAARGGLEQQRYPVGRRPDAERRAADERLAGPISDAQYARGRLPRYRSGRAFPPNGYGLYNMTGNVWEWCADWFSATFHVHGSRKNPKGPRSGTHRVMRGGSYLCHDSYCYRYRVAARSANTPDSSTGKSRIPLCQKRVTQFRHHQQAGASCVVALQPSP